MDKKHLDWAIFHAVKMWGDPFYERFLRQKHPGHLNDEVKMYDWFKIFVRDWSVARNIKDREKVREYLDKNFRAHLKSGNPAIAVDRAAQFIKDRGWTSKESKNGNGPVSLVSKIGFFFMPNTLIPYDSLARLGLKAIRKKEKRTRKSDSMGGTYETYYKTFSEEFDSRESEIRKALTKPQVKKLVKRFRCRHSDLGSLAFRRKIFDNYLMSIGRAKKGEKHSG